DDGDLPIGLLLVLGEARHELLLPLPDPVPLLALGDASAHIEGVGADLDGDVRVCLDVVEPVGVRRGAALGREDSEAVAHLLVGQRIDPLLAALRATRMEEQQSPTLERPTDLAGIGPELGDDLGVPVVPLVAHDQTNIIASTTISPGARTRWPIPTRHGLRPKGA